MAYEKCPKCEGAGKITTEEPVTSDAMGEVEKECDLCDGIGWLYEDATPRLISGLNEIIEILNRIETKIAGGK